MSNSTIVGNDLGVVKTLIVELRLERLKTLKGLTVKRKERA